MNKDFAVLLLSLASCDPGAMLLFTQTEKKANKQKAKKQRKLYE